MIIFLGNGKGELIDGTRLAQTYLWSKQAGLLSEYSDCSSTTIGSGLESEGRRTAPLHNDGRAVLAGRLVLLWFCHLILVWRGSPKTIDKVKREG